MNEPVSQPVGNGVCAYVAVVGLWVVVVSAIIGVRAARHGTDDPEILNLIGHLLFGIIWPLALVCYAAYWTTKAVMWNRKKEEP